MNFANALNLVLDGQVVRRRAWPDGIILAFRKNRIVMVGSMGETEPFSFHEANTKALDWEVTKEAFDFKEAFRRLLQGKKVRAVSWYNPKMHAIYNEGLLMVHAGDFSCHLSVGDIPTLNNEWEEYTD